MRIDGVGSNMVNSSHSHQVTDCVQPHSAQKSKGGGLNTPPVSVEKRESVAESPAAQTADMGWLSKLLAGGKGFLNKLWNSGGKEEIGPALTEAEVLEEAGRKALEKGMSDSKSRQDFQENAPKKQAEVNPYFIPVEEPKGADTMWQRFKLKVQTATGHLAKKFGREPSFQTGTGKEERRHKGEDLRKHSRYKQGQEEIECIITDDSYLLDSYDKSGKYSKLAQKGDSEQKN